MVKTIKPRKKGGLTNTALVEKVRQWVTLDKDEKLVSARKTELRDQLMTWVEEHGYEDSDGHWWIDLPGEVEGVIRLKRERAISQSMNAQDALDFVKAKAERVKDEEKKALLKDCVKTIEVIDEDALAAAVFKKAVTEKELDALVTRKETYRFKPQRVK